MSVEEYYRRWQDLDLVDRFAAKKVGEFFESEIRFLDRHGAAIRSVLDIGCASASMLELLRQRTAVEVYTGLDIVAENVERAQARFPDAEFVIGNALEFEPVRSYDLVNATGVMQHEPRYEALIERMLNWSRKYILFDVKFALVDAPVVDLSRSRAGTSENPLYFILLSYPAFRDFLTSLDDVEGIDIYGYPTPTNSRVVVPPEISCVVSACVMITKGSRRVRDFLRADVPALLNDKHGAR